MDMIVDPDQLAKVPLFEGLGSYALSEIAEHTVKTYVRPGIRLVKAGENGFTFSTILNGTADVRVEGEKVATLRTGDVFGEMALVTGQARNADVVATSEMVLASMMVWDFREMLQKHREVKERLDRIVAERSGA